MRSRIPFAKILIALVIVFLVSLGLCGASLIFNLQPANQRSAAAHLMGSAFLIEMAGMVLSAAGIFVTFVVWVVVVIFTSSQKVSQPQDQIDPADGTKLDKRDME